MTDFADQLGQYSKLAIETAASELGVAPLELARRLNQAEIARLMVLLNAALQHVDHPALRHRIEDVLMSVTDGRLPSDRTEGELEWALKVTARRRAERNRRSGSTPDE